MRDRMSRYISQKCDSIAPPWGVDPSDSRPTDPVSVGANPFVRPAAAQLLVSGQSRRDLNWDEEVARENIVVKVTKRRRRMKLAGRNPSVRIGPLPAVR